MVVLQHQDRSVDELETEGGSITGIWVVFFGEKMAAGFRHHVLVVGGLDAHAFSLIRLCEVFQREQAVWIISERVRITIRKWLCGVA